MPTLITWLPVFVLVILYHLVPFLGSSLSGVLAARLAIVRGVSPDDLHSLIMPVIAHDSPVLVARWIRRNLLWTRSPVLCFIDDEVLRVMPWLWPLWLPQQIAIRLRCVERAVDARWRVF